VQEGTGFRTSTVADQAPPKPGPPPTVLSAGEPTPRVPGKGTDPSATVRHRAHGPGVYGVMRALVTRNASTSANASLASSRA
jgi:hypothetical protein